MVKEKPKSLVMLERIDRGERVACPSCGRGHWHKIYSTSGETFRYECDFCGKCIIPRFRLT